MLYHFICLVFGLVRPPGYLTSHNVRAPLSKNESKFKAKLHFNSKFIDALWPALIKVIASEIFISMLLVSQLIGIFKPYHSKCISKHFCFSIFDQITFAAAQHIEHDVG